MGRKKVTADNLSEKFDEILDKYAEDLEDSLAEVMKEASKTALTALKNESRVFKDAHLPKGRYATGWRVEDESTRLRPKFILHNAKYPWLPHLLENPHAKRGGGRTQGTPHIEKVERQITDDLVKKIEAKL